MKKADPNPKANHSILLLSYVVVALFLGMLAYFGFFVQVKSEKIINNSYNARLDRFSDRILRGRLLSSDGRVLAQTLKNEDGSEVREYPYGPLFSHVIGYSSVGKTGLEALGNFYLLSSHVNLAEKVINELSSVKNQGDNVVTTLDLDLQQAAYDALGDRKGAVIVMEPDTGKVLAMVSKPDFDPNRLSEQWSSLVSSDNKEAQLLNRATQGLYPPGSTFKIITALEYIRENPATYEQYHFDCDGFYENGEYTIKCYHETAHGSQNLREAFANSCNGAFSNLGLKLNLTSLKSLTDTLLFGAEQPVSIAYNKSSYSMTEGAGLWEILQTSIGQGNTQITPFHNALITSAIANGGILMKPYFIDRVENGGGETIEKFLPASYGSLMTAEEAGAVTSLMRSVVTDGTGSAFRDAAYEVAGKTGSAEFETGKETHAWFTGFAPASDPEITVCVIVEEGGSGGAVAAPVARAVMDAYFSR